MPTPLNDTLRFTVNYDETTATSTDGNVVVIPTNSTWFDFQVIQALRDGSPLMTRDQAIAYNNSNSSLRSAYPHFVSFMGRVNGGPEEMLYTITNYVALHTPCADCGALGYNRVSHLGVNHCEACCEHPYCGNCRGDGYTDRDICDSCSNCVDHCYCVEAECGCMVFDGYQCGGCDNCNRHCSCQHPVFVRPGAEPTFHHATSHEINSSKRHVAAEIELSSAEDYQSIAETIRYWGAAIVSDGSLPDGGIEINTAPANGDKLVEQLDHIGSTLRTANAEADTSCGVHVHIDARDFEYEDLRKLVLIYEKIEDTLFDMMPADRKDNHYAHKCADMLAFKVRNYHSARDIKMSLVNTIYGIEVDMNAEPRQMTPRELRYERVYGSSRMSEQSVDMFIEELKHDKYNSARYSALNLHSWFYRGTVECRLFNGTTDMGDVQHWAMLWAAILDNAKEMTESQIEELSVDGRELLLAMTPREDTRQWIEKRIDEYENDTRYSRW